MAAGKGQDITIPYRKTGRGITIEVRVEPRSSKKGIVGALGSMLKVKLTAPPVEGAANEQLVEVIAEALGVRKSDVRVIRGQSSRNKVVEVLGLRSL
ncbi:MAG: DUF167 domain-containing protein [Nitrospiraceae bacterium]|nr:DUF167 domain-containing protein [Nitrospiraceae bacterium]